MVIPIPTAKLRIIPFTEDNSALGTLVGSVAGTLGDLGYGSGFTVQINPESINFSHNLEYDKDLPINSVDNQQSFIRKEPGTLSFEITFDRTGAVQSGDLLGNEIALLSAQGVNMDLNKLKKMVLDYDGKIHRPKPCKIVWGMSFQENGPLAFRGQLASLTYTYTRFNNFGIPLRAKVNISFKGFLEKKLQERLKNAQSSDITHLVTVKEGDTLPYIAYKIYGDSK